MENVSFLAYVIRQTYWRIEMMPSRRENGFNSCIERRTVFVPMAFSSVFYVVSLGCTVHVNGL